MLMHQPIGAVEFAPFFIRSEGKDQVALRLVAFAMQAKKHLDQGSVGILHILRSAAVEVAVLLHKLEGIGRPVRAQRLHHVHVAEKEDGLFRGCARGANADHEILLVRVWAQQMYVFRREPRVKKAPLHSRGARSYIALRRVGGVDLDEFLKDGSGERTVLWRRLGQ